MFDYDGDHERPDYKTFREIVSYEKPALNDVTSGSTAPRQYNPPVARPSSPYEHLNADTQISRATRVSPAPYEELNNDVWKEIFKSANEHAKSFKSAHVRESQELDNDVGKERFPIGKHNVDKTDKNVTQMADFPNIKSANQRQLNLKDTNVNHFDKRDEIDHVSFDRKKTAQSHEGVEDYFHDLNCIRSGNQHLPRQEQQYGPDCISGRPLPVIPIYESLTGNTHKTRLRKTVSQRMCVVMAGTFLVLCAVIAVVVITVVLIVNVPNQVNNEITVRKDTLSATSFIEKSKLLGILTKKSSIRGITVLNSEIFVLRNGSSQVIVYNTNNFTWSRNFKISGASYLWAIVASSRHNCLYISDVTMNAVYRYNLSSRVITQWVLNDTCYGLSLTSTDNVLVTLSSDRQIIEYTPEGIFVKAISLDRSIENPWHSIQLSGDRFVVSHVNTSGSLHRVCIVDMGGHIIQCYGATEGLGVGQLSQPRNLAADVYGNILVADRDNNRVVLLSPSLTHLGFITVPEHQLSGPFDLLLDQVTSRLYIAERAAAGRLCILTY